MKRCVLELGGKAPLVVLPGADLDAVAEAASFGAFMNSGQICMSTERIIVDRDLSADVAARLAARAGQLVVGDPRAPETMIGPVVDHAARERILELIEDALAKGARVVAGGTAVGNCVAPTVLAGVTPAMRIYGEESFGPVVGIVDVDDIDDAVRVANDTEYGLAAAVFGPEAAALDVARRIDSGICHVNSATVHDEPQMPFGGVKASGWGRFGGSAGVAEFTELRWMTLQQGPSEYPI
jgi:vanillin dehydrogenase